MFYLFFKRKSTSIHVFPFSSFISFSLCVCVLSCPKASGDIKKHLRGLAVTLFVKEQTVRGLLHTQTLLTLSNLRQSLHSLTSHEMMRSLASILVIDWSFGWYVPILITLTLAETTWLYQLDLLMDNGQFLFSNIINAFWVNFCILIVDSSWLIL